MIWLGVLAALVAWYVVEARRRRSHPVEGGLQNHITLPHSEPVELYSNSFSHCSRKVRLALAELGVAHAHHHVDLVETGWYQTISPDYLRVNRAGLVPTLIHNGHPVYESDDILLHAKTLAGKDGADLEPAALKDDIIWWLHFCNISSDNPMRGMAEQAGSCIPALTLPLFATAIRYIPLRRILIGLLFHSDRKRPVFFAATKLLGLERTLQMKPVRHMLGPARQAMAQHLITLNTALQQSDGEWLLGEQFTLADITVSALLLRLEETGWLAHFSETSDLGAVSAYYNRLKARPSWAAAIDDMRHPIVDRATEDLQREISNPSIQQLLYGS